MTRLRSALLAASAFAALSGAATAQTVRVQAGEHATFTRIVVETGVPSAWRLTRTDDGYELDLGLPGAAFDLASVFRVIPRSRLAAIWSDPQTGHLRMRIACACHAVPFEFRDTILVIDLRNGPSAAGSAFELDRNGVRQAPLTDRRAALVRPRAAPPRPELRAATPGTAASLGPRPTAVALPYLQPAPPELDPAITAAPPTANLGPLRDMLVQELARAASAGLIDIETTVPPATSAVPAMTGAPAEVARHMGVQGPPGMIAYAGSGPPDPSAASGRPCLADESFDIGAWAGPGGFPEQAAELHRLLVGEFDRVDAAILLRLARLKLHFGMGAETLALLRGFPGVLADEDLLATLALLVEGQPTTDAGWDDQITCSGKVALWAFLATPEPASLAKADAGPATLGFSMLPVHLRRALGPILAEKLLDAGQVEAARRVREAIWRVPGDPGPAAALIDGRIAEARGKIEQAEQTYASVAETGGTPAVRALIELVETRIALGRPLDPETITEISALRTEHRGDPLEPELLRAEMLAEASAGNYERAFAISRQTDGPDNAEVWDLLARTGSDAALLDHAVLQRGTPLPAVDTQTRERIGDRLLLLGFPDQALGWLPAANVVRIAQARLAAGDARSALQSIAGERGPEAERIRAAALERLDDRAAAARAYASAGDAAAQTATLWRARQWQEAASPDFPARAEILATRRVPPEEPGPPSLGAGRQQIEESVRLRAAIDSLLDESPAP